MHEEERVASPKQEIKIEESSNIKQNEEEAAVIEEASSSLEKE